MNKKNLDKCALSHSSQWMQRLASADDRKSRVSVSSSTIEGVVIGHRVIGVENTRTMCSYVTDVVTVRRLGMGAAVVRHESS